MKDGLCWLSDFTYVKRSDDRNKNIDGGIRMDIKKIANNCKGHLRIVLRHKKEVMINCFKCGLIIQGITHDLSKFSPSEFFPSVMNFQGDRSPNEGERDKYGYSKAWMHHKGRNKHHFEYWTDYSVETRELEPVRIPKRFVIEMFCDRVAASKIYLGENYDNSAALNYFLKGKKKRKIHPKTGEELERLLRMLEEKGESETFRYIRRAVFLNREL